MINDYTKEVLLTIVWLVFVFAALMLSKNWALAPSKAERMADKGYANTCIELPGGYHAWHWMAINSTEYSDVMKKNISGGKCD